MTSDGVANASALVSAHQDALAETGYEFELRTSRDNGAESVQRGAATAGLSSILLTETATSDSTTDGRTMWANESVVLVKYDEGSTTLYNEVRRTSEGRTGFVGRATKAATLAGLLRTGEFTVSRVVRTDEGTLTTLRADSYSGGGYFGEVSEYDATLVVDSAGRAREFHWSVASERTTFDRTFELTALGRTTLDRPEWTDEAIAVPSPTISTTTDSGRLEITHEGGDVLPAGSKLDVEHDGETYVRTFEEPLEAGETAYFYLSSDGGDPVLTTDDPGPEAGVRFDGAYQVRILGPNANPVYSAGFSVGHSESSSDEPTTETASRSEG
ncbi:hypothetical protein DMJ13_25330 [halophilic archaeon]|nr:hypothetical protein DMJ13_25330 [halophilic archaeon]